MKRAKRRDFLISISNECEITRDANITTATTFARSPCASRDAAAPSSHRPSCAVSTLLDQSVRYLPLDALRLFTSCEARDAFSLTAIARKIAVYRAPHSEPASQSSLFVSLRPSQAGSTADLAGRAAMRSRC